MSATTATRVLGPINEPEFLTNQDLDRIPTDGGLNILLDYALDEDDNFSQEIGAEVDLPYEYFPEQDNCLEHWWDGEH